MTTDRFYFANNGTGGTGLLPAGAWWTVDSSGGLALLTAPAGTLGNSSDSTTAVASRRTRHESFRATTPRSGTLEGTLNLVMATRQNADGSNASLALRVRVVSSDGALERGVLFEGIDDLEFAITTSHTGAATRRITGTMTPVTGVQPTDHIVVDVGSSVAAATSGGGIYIYYGSSTLLPDYPATDGVPQGDGRPWIDFVWTDPPAPPTDLTQTAATATTADVAWTPPATGEAPTGYEYRLDGAAPVAVGLATTLTLEGLAPATDYLLEVRTLAATGTSAWAPLTVTTAAAAGLGELRLEVGPEDDAVDLLGPAYSIRINRGPSAGPVVDRLEVGTLVAVIDGPAANPVTTPQVRPDAPVRVLCYAATAEGLAWTPIYTGKLDRARVEFDGGADKADAGAYRVTLTALDVVADAAETPPGPAVSGSLTQRIDSLLAPTGLAYAVTDADAPRTDTRPLATSARNALEALELARNTAHAIAYADRTNTLRIVADSARPRAELVPDFTATDVPADGGLHYWSLVPVYDTSAITNVLELTRLEVGTDDTVETHVDPDSRTAWGPRSESVTVNDGVLETHADKWLATRATPDLVPEQLSLNVGARPEHLAAAVTLEPYAVVRITRTGVLPAPVDVSVRTITHTIAADATRGVRWLITLDLRPLEVLTTRWKDVPVGYSWADFRAEFPDGMTWRESVRWRPWLP